MPYNKDWDRWITASVNKYFDSVKGSYPLHCMGTAFDLTISKVNKVELYVLTGPVKERSGNDWELNYNIVIAINIIKDEKDFYKLQKAIGYFAQYFLTIPIFNYGENDPGIFGCLNLVREIDITTLGQQFQDVSVEQAVIKASYKFNS